MENKRSILHFDLDSFFVSVERLFDKTLIGKPVIVGGTGQRGVVSSCSYEARKFGVHSAMPIMKARKLCPQGIFVGGHMHEYSRFSKIVTEIIASKSPLFEKASIDEFYVDLSGMDKFFGTLKWSSELRRTIIHETHLPISFGLSVNKMLAKMSTNEAKPNGEFFLEPGKEQAFLDPMPVGKIPFCGEKTVEFLKKKNIETIYQLRQYEQAALEHWLGKGGTMLYKRARGIDNAPIIPSHDAKSMSSERTFNFDTDDISWLETVILSLAENLAYDLRHDNKLASCVTIKIRYADFSTTSKQLTIDHTANTKTIIEQSLKLFRAHYNRHQKIRLIGVRLSGLADGNQQINLFDDKPEEIELYRAIDKMKTKYGSKKILLARGLDLGSVKHNDPRASLSKKIDLK